MIPKIIHYCWVGGNPKSDVILKCIESWHKVMPDYEIKEWNENNFDISKYAFAKEAYSVGKYAFVSDQLRYVVLQQYGGIFLDCDVEVLKPLDPLLSNKCFFAIEGHIGNKYTVNPGLVIGCEKGSCIVGVMAKIYADSHFLSSGGHPNLHLTSPNMLTKELVPLGFVNENKEQLLNDEIRIYPTQYFDPIDHTTIKGNKPNITAETYAVHWGAASWLGASAKYRRIISIILRRIFGDKFIDYIRNK